MIQDQDCKAKTKTKIMTSRCNTNTKTARFMTKTTTARFETKIKTRITLFNNYEYWLAIQICFTSQSFSSGYDDFEFEGVGGGNGEFSINCSQLQLSHFYP